jgi:hypothetical protein
MSTTATCSTASFDLPRESMPVHCLAGKETTIVRPRLDASNESGVSAPQAVSAEASTGVLDAFDRWTDGFLDRMARWAEASGHHRLGSWTRL